MSELELLKAKYQIALQAYAKFWRKTTHYNKMTKTFDEEITKQAQKELDKKDGTEE